METIFKKIYVKVSKRCLTERIFQVILACLMAIVAAKPGNVVYNTGSPLAYSGLGYNGLAYNGLGYNNLAYNTPLAYNAPLAYSGYRAPLTYSQTPYACKLKSLFSSFLKLIFLNYPDNSPIVRSGFPAYSAYPSYAGQSNLIY